MNLAGQQRLIQFGHELTYRANGAAVGVCYTYLETVSQEIRKIAAGATTRVENSSPAVESATKELIEKINVDLPELLSELGRHAEGHGQ